MELPKVLEKTRLLKIQSMYGVAGIIPLQVVSPALTEPGFQFSTTTGNAFF